MNKTLPAKAITLAVIGLLVTSSILHATTATTVTEIDTNKIKPEFFWDKENKVNVRIVVGPSSAAEDVVAAQNLAVAIPITTKISRELVEIVKGGLKGEMVWDIFMEGTYEVEEEPIEVYYNILDQDKYFHLLAKRTCGQMVYPEGIPYIYPPINAKNGSGILPGLGEQEYIEIKGEIDDDNGRNYDDPDEWEVEIPRYDDGEPPLFEDGSPRFDWGIIHWVDLRDRNYPEGVYEGEQIVLGGDVYTILEVDPDEGGRRNLEGTLRLGRTVETKWVRSGDKLYVGEYIVELLDVSLYEYKAVIRVYDRFTGAFLVEKPILLDIGRYGEWFGQRREDYYLQVDDLIIRVTGAFVGADGLVTAKISVGTSVLELENGERLRNDSNWRVYLFFGEDPEEDEDTVTRIVFANQRKFHIDRGERIYGPRIRADRRPIWEISYLFEEREIAREEFDVGSIVIRTECMVEELTVPELLGLITRMGMVVDTEYPPLDVTLVGELEYIEPPENLVLLTTDVTDDIKRRYNLILVGGGGIVAGTNQVANPLVKELTEAGKTTIDYTTLDHPRIEYISDPWGKGKDVIIVAGRDRDQTVIAVNKLRQMVINMAKERVEKR